MFEKTIETIRVLKEDNDGSAVGFIIGMFLVIVIAINLLPSFANQAFIASNNTSVLSFGGVSALIGVLVLLFVILPLVILARAAS